MKLDRTSFAVNDRRQQRVIWMILNYPVWQDLPVPPVTKGKDWGSWKRKYNRDIVRRMKEEGLVEQTTYWFDVNIPLHIHMALEALGKEKCQHTLR